MHAGWPQIGTAVEFLKVQLSSKMLLSRSSVQFIAVTASTKITVKITPSCCGIAALILLNQRSWFLCSDGVDILDVPAEECVGDAVPNMLICSQQY
jgi:hypothetical protein